MTLALAIRCSDGLVLATDSRASGGGYAAVDSSEKFLQVNRDVGIMTYGLGEPGYRTMRELVEGVRESPGKFATMDKIVERARKISIKRFKEFTKSNPTHKETVGFIIAGFDGNETGLFRIFHLQSEAGFSPVEESELIAAQWPLPKALSPYLPFSGMSIKQGVNLACILMVTTAAVNQAVGGPIRLATVAIERGFSLLSEHEAQELVGDNQERLVRLKMAWVQGWLSV